jgi:thymidylate synthase (FAD)
MPKNNYLTNQHEPLYTERKFGKQPNVTFVDQFDAIKVTIVDAPTVEQMRKLLPVFMYNSWQEQPKFDGFTDEEIDTCIAELFAGSILPTGMETIGITFCVEGLDLVDVTHLIRHRAFSFSAQCSDRDLRNLTALVKPSIYENDGFFERYAKIVLDSVQLYADMMDSGEINTFDARTILPICKSHFYNVRGCIKDIIAFCNQRCDEQIQPQSDNIVAIKLWLEISKLYPFLKDTVNLRQQAKYYVNQCKNGKTTIFPPNKANDVFDWPESQFFHKKHRDEFNGGEVYLKLRDKLLSELDKL